MTELLAAVFVASLVGSLHCAGMCGGLVTLCVAGAPVGGRGRDRGWASHLPHVVYNLGRLVTYAALGAVSGAVGAAIDLGGSAVGLDRAAAIVAGGMMIFLGAAALLRWHTGALSGVKVPAWLGRLFQRGYRAASGRPPVQRAAVVGLLTGFLPCGWLYAFVLAAAAAGGPVAGALTMVAFWAGTVPILLAMGLGVQTIVRRLGPHVPTMTAAALLLVGVLTIFGRLNLPAYAGTMGGPAVAAGDSGDSRLDAAAIDELTSEPPPCCHEPD